MSATRRRGGMSTALFMALVLLAGVIVIALANATDTPMCRPPIFNDCGAFTTTVVR